MPAVAVLRSIPSAVEVWPAARPVSDPLPENPAPLVATFPSSVSLSAVTAALLLTEIACDSDPPPSPTCTMPKLTGPAVFTVACAGVYTLPVSATFWLPTDSGVALSIRPLEVKSTAWLPVNVPAVAVGWKLPSRGIPDDVPTAVLADLLASGEASRLYQGLVKGKELLLGIEGGVNWPLGDPWTYEGPTLLTLFGLYKPDTTAKAVVAAIDEEVAKVARGEVSAEELERTKTKMVSDLYAQLEMPMERAVALSLAQLFTGEAASVNDVPRKLAAVTRADLARVAAKYLTAPNRTVVDRRPAPQKPEGPAAAGK